MEELEPYLKAVPGRGLHSSTSRLNISSFWGYVCRGGSSGAHYEGVSCPSKAVKCPYRGSGASKQGGKFIEKNGSVELEIGRV